MTPEDKSSHHHPGAAADFEHCPLPPEWERMVPKRPAPPAENTKRMAARGGQNPWGAQSIQPAPVALVEGGEDLPAEDASPASAEASKRTAKAANHAWLRRATEQSGALGGNGGGMPDPSSWITSPRGKK